MLGDRDKEMLADGGHEWRKMIHEDSFDIYKEKGDGGKFFISRYTA